MNIILIDLTNSHDSDIVTILQQCNSQFPSAELCRLNKSGIGRVWLNLDNDTIFAYEIRGKRTMEIGDVYKNKLWSMTPTKPKEIVTEELIKPVEKYLSEKTNEERLNEILDKISNFGQSSLTKEELDFLMRIPFKK